jgi:hypothetical protein
VTVLVVVLSVPESVLVDGVDVFVDDVGVVEQPIWVLPTVRPTPLVPQYETVAVLPLLVGSTLTFVVEPLLETPTIGLLGSGDVGVGVGDGFIGNGPSGDCSGLVGDGPVGPLPPGGGVVPPPGGV